MATLSEQEQKDLLSAFNKFLAVFKPMFFDVAQECKNFSYGNYVRYHTEEGPEKEMYKKMENLMYMAGWIRL